jgi:hypothetical protein
MSEPVSTAQPPASPAVARIVSFFETLSPEQLANLSAFYTVNASFKDPFNEVRGVPAIEAIFRHMYVALDRPRFVVTDAITQGHQCFLTWNFEFYFRRFDTTTLQTVRGGSHLKLTEDGLIDLHRDYWDAAEELYEKLPAVGSLMRWLKKRANQ